MNRETLRALPFVIPQALGMAFVMVVLVLMLVALGG